MNARHHKGIELMKSQWWYFLLIFVFLITSCNLPSQTNTETPVPTLASLTPTKSPAKPTIKASPIPTSILSVTSTPSQISSEPTCVLSKVNQTLVSTSFDNYPESIQGFINDGATPDELDKALYDLGIENQPIGVASADMTGDGKTDIVVSVFDPSSENIPPSGKLLIFICENGQYKLLLEQDSEMNWGAPGIRYLQDIDADGRAELVESSPSCGASTCFEDVQVQVWNGSGFEDRFEGDSTDLPFPDIRISDPNNDGFFQIEIVASGFGSVGAGPQRNFTRVWSYHPDSRFWIPGKDILGPSNYRIHVLFDAEVATSQGNYQDALQLYGRVIHDTTLDDWIDPEKERADLAAYALFKTALVYILQGQDSFAETTFKQLADTYPVGTSQHSYVLMADAFRSNYQSNGFSTACTAAREFALNHADQVLSPLSSQSFGYANKDYTPQDVCPIP